LKKLILSIFIVNVLAQSAHAIGINTSAYYDKGAIFSGSTFPQSTANAVNLPKQQNLQKLKTGYAAKTNFFGLVEIGDSGIDKAAKQANITQIHYVDTTVSKVYIPLLFIPIYAKTTRTTVYGE
jgi:hypothetical protein